MFPYLCLIPTRLVGGVLLAAGVAALGGFAVQQLAGVGDLRGLAAPVQGLLSQENSGPQITTRCQRTFNSLINIYTTVTVIIFSEWKSGLVQIGNEMISALKQARISSTQKIIFFYKIRLNSTHQTHFICILFSLLECNPPSPVQKMYMYVGPTL